MNEYIYGNTHSYPPTHNILYKYEKITNSEEMAKSKIGTILYEKLIKDYTLKQWNKYPEELDKSVLERIPIRANFDTRYFTDKYQALPHKGYTHFFERLLANKNIEIYNNKNNLKKKINLNCIKKNKKKILLIINSYMIEIVFLENTLKWIHKKLNITIPKKSEASKGGIILTKDEIESLKII